MIRSEDECYEELKDALKRAQSAARRIGFIKADRRWQTIGDMIHKMEENVRQLLLSRTH